MILTDEEIREIDTSEYWFEHTPQEFAREIEAAVLEKLASTQEPVAAQHRFRHPQKTMPDWSVWQPCGVSDRLPWRIDSQGYEVEYRSLYNHPAPAQKPLTSINSGQEPVNERAVVHPEKHLKKET